MRISLVQPDTHWENKKENFRALETLITPLFNQTDIVILPEMFNTGFSMKTEILGESVGEETFVWMKQIALNGNFGLCGSYIVRENNRFYNRFIFVSPGPEVWFYNKRHLFGMAAERDFISPGNEKVLFSFRGVRISPFICYDLRFPVWSRNRNEVDLLIYSANWPVARKEAWNILTKARAIENQCYVAAVNRIGKDRNGILYCGESGLIHPFGHMVISAGPDRECCVTAEISISELSEIRRKFPVLDDADDFTIKP